MNNKLFTILIGSSALLLLPNILTTFGQTNSELQEQVSNNTGQVDMNTVLTGTGIAGVIYTAAKQLIDQKKNKKEDQGTDKDITTTIANIGKIFAYAYVIDPHWKKILDSPVDQNPMNSDIKIGHVFTKDMQEWIDYTRTVIQAPVPNMSIAISPVNPATNETTESTESTTETPKTP